jgi:hypothetical protein
MKSLPSREKKHKIDFCLESSIILLSSPKVRKTYYKDKGSELKSRC